MRVDSDLTPRNRLFRTSASVASIKLLSGVNVHREVGAVTHQVRVRDVVLHNTASENDHARLGSVLRDGVDLHDVLHHINHETRVHVAVEEEHIADAAVGNRGAEHGNVVL